MKNMMKNYLTLLVFTAMPAVVTAQGFQLAPGETVVSVNGIAMQQGASNYYPAPAMQSAPYHAPAPTSYRAPAARSSLAQSKANRMANSGVMRHLGGGFGAGHYEGVGMASTREGAIRNCCYWGRKTPIDIGAASNGRRWFACVIYR